MNRIHLALFVLFVARSTFAQIGQNEIAHSIAVNGKESPAIFSQLKSFNKDQRVFRFIVSGADIYIFGKNKSNQLVFSRYNYPEDSVFKFIDSTTVNKSNFTITDALLFNYGNNNAYVACLIEEVKDADDCDSVITKVIVYHLGDEKIPDFNPYRYDLGKIAVNFFEKEKNDNEGSRICCIKKTSNIVKVELTVRTMNGAMCIVLIRNTHMVSKNGEMWILKKKELLISPSREKITQTLDITSDYLAFDKLIKDALSGKSTAKPNPKTQKILQSEDW